MTRQAFGAPTFLVVALVAVGLTLGSCGGGGGGGGGQSSQGLLAEVSFVGFNSQPSGQGPNGNVPLPQVFIDQTLEFGFDAPVDDGIFGGFFEDPANPGVPREFLGVSPSISTGGIPYFAYVNQSAAQSSLEIRTNLNPLADPPGAVLGSYIVGRHATKPNTIVIDPRVTAANLLGLPFNNGFAAGVEYTYRITPNNGIRLGGGTQAQALGTTPLQLPVVINPFAPAPLLSPVFRVGNSTGPDPVPPRVISIEALSGLPGTNVSPIPTGDSIVITFSKGILPSSINRLENLVIRNTDLTTAQFPEGRIVPGDPFIDPQSPERVVFTPAPSFGPGVSPTQGYAIEVLVGTFTQGGPEITGFPQGAPPVPLALENTRTRTFITMPDPNAQLAVGVIEAFEDSSMLDAGFTPTFANAEWNGDVPGSLSGTPISGDPQASFRGNPGDLGTRTQVEMPIGPGTNLPLTTTPFPGLFSPFDSPINGNVLPGMPSPNPNGGSHSMWLVENTDVGTPTSSLELIEWGALNNVIVQSIYPQYECWAGQTTVAGGIACPTGQTGMSTVYALNYDMDNTQAADPNNLNPNPPAATANAGGVLVTPASAYNATTGFTSYFPFPVFTPPFDYIGSGAGSGNLLYEINIEPGMQVANFNRYRATAFTPVRRNIGVPLSLGMVTGSAGGCDTYASRFTFVDIVSSVRSQFFDTGVSGTQIPVYTQISISPSPMNQPDGTESRWEFEGTTSIAGPTSPSGPTTGFLTYYDGDNTGMTNESILGTTPGGLVLTGNRFFRFRVTMRNDNIGNVVPQYNDLVTAIIVGGP